MSTLRQRVHGHPAVRSAAPPPASHASSGRVADTPTIRARRPTSSTPPPPPPVPPVPPVPVITITTPSPREDTLPLQRCGPAILDSDPNIPEYLRGTPFASVESLERHFAEFELRRNLLRPPPPPASEAPNRSVAVAVFRPASSVMPGMSLRLDTVSESPTPPGNPSRFIQHPSATQRIRLPNGLADLGRGDNDEEDSGLPPSSGLSSSLADTIRDYVNVRLPSMTGLDGTLQMPPGNIEREGDEHGYVSFAEFEERERARRLRTRELSEDEQVRADKLAARKARHEAMFAQQEEFAARPPRRNFFVEPPPLRDLYDCSHEPPPPKVPNRGRGWSKVQPWIPKPPPPEDRFFARERRKEMEAKLKAEKEALLNDMTKVVKDSDAAPKNGPSTRKGKGKERAVDPSPDVVTRSASSSDDLASMSDWDATIKVPVKRSVAVTQEPIRGRISKAGMSMLMDALRTTSFAKAEILSSLPINSPTRRPGPEDASSSGCPQELKDAAAANRPPQSRVALSTSSSNADGFVEVYHVEKSEAKAGSTSTRPATDTGLILPRATSTTAAKLKPKVKVANKTNAEAPRASGETKTDIPNPVRAERTRVVEVSGSATHHADAAVVEASTINGARWKGSVRLEYKDLQDLDSNQVARRANPTSASSSASAPLLAASSKPAHGRLVIKRKPAAAGRDGETFFEVSGSATAGSSTTVIRGPPAGPPPPTPTSSSSTKPAPAQHAAKAASPTVVARGFSPQIARSTSSTRDVATIKSPTPVSRDSRPQPIRSSSSAASSSSSTKPRMKSGPDTASPTAMSKGFPPATPRSLLTASIEGLPDHHIPLARRIRFEEPRPPKHMMQTPSRSKTRSHSSTLQFAPRASPSPQTVTPTPSSMLRATSLQPTSRQFTPSKLSRSHSAVAIPGWAPNWVRAPQPQQTPPSPKLGPLDPAVEEWPIAADITEGIEENDGLSRSNSETPTHRSIPTPYSSCDELYAMLDNPEDPTKLTLFPKYPGTFDGSDSEDEDKVKSPSKTSSTRGSSISTLASVIGSYLTFGRSPSKVSPKKNDAQTTEEAAPTPSKVKTPLKAIRTADWPTGRPEIEDTAEAGYVPDPDMRMSTMRRSGPLTKAETAAWEAREAAKQKDAEEAALLKDSLKALAKGARTALSSSHFETPSSPTVPPSPEMARCTEPENGTVLKLGPAAIDPDVLPSPPQSTSAHVDTLTQTTKDASPVEGSKPSSSRTKESTAAVRRSHGPKKEPRKKRGEPTLRTPGRKSPERDLAAAINTPLTASSSSSARDVTSSASPRQTRTSIIKSRRTVTEISGSFYASDLAAGPINTADAAAELDEDDSGYDTEATVRPGSAGTVRRKTRFVLHQEP